MRGIGLASALVLLTLTGCGSSDSAPSSKPLAGTVEKKAFKAMNAFALTGEMPSEKFVVIRDKKSDCTDGSEIEKGDLVVTVEVPWKDGEVANVGTDAKVTFDDLPDSVIAVSGQVDVLHAPTGIGDKGAIRVLADALDDASKVDGQVDFVVCE